MKKVMGQNRRNFMKGVGMTALMSAAAGSNGAFAMGQSRGRRSKYNFDEIYSRVGVNSIKWDSAIRRYGKENITVPMGIADLDFRQMPEVVQALKKRADYDNYGYESLPASYYEAIIDWNKDRYGLEVKREWIRNSSALKPGMISSMRALNPVKGKVILQTPTYSGFTGAINKAGMRVEMNPMKKVDGRWHMDLEDLESRLDYETKCLILCNPNNPSGECWTADELRALGDVCMRHGVTVLADEIHCDYVNKGHKFTPYASIGEKYANSSISYRSPSKTFGHANLKVAYFFTQNQDLMDATMIGGGHDAGCNAFGLIACETAFREGRQWVDEVTEYVDGNFDFLVEAVNKDGNMPGIEYSKPEGTYLAWLDCNGLMAKVITPEYRKAYHDKMRDAGRRHGGLTPEMALSEWIVDACGVQLNAGSSYGIGSGGFMRMNIAIPRSSLKTALDNLSKACKMA
ncbi:MAG: aminotransferase class I/II-fold pyridoxal phosphate-dependent enzyme [Kordiimonadaceae bacterium]|jgi:cysteine-S-conjugate beta-lyase|nr:aminotransferase class I/II-fold pyridoxal phosphate-dependent enzyme [Kordiimonadaceae bacterium]MBT6032605.1 aminotransferase class I/II-fold pyridoxal phosphate-dependent enzyme [Kordiimonadaceae bacterium]